MSGKTHAQFAIGFGYAVALILDNFFSIGLNFYLLILLMPLLSMRGAKFPDYDHHWKSISDRTAISWCVSKFIHLTGGSHRSKHTHSWDICLVSLALLWLGTEKLFEYQIFSALDRGIAFTMLLGFYSGWISHLISDMFNGDGVWPTVFALHKVAFVPKKLFGIKFNTGGAWERFFYKMSVFINRVLGVVVLIYPIFKSGLLEQLINKWL